ncbi:F-box protein At5g07610-like [Triticum aestivum]|uniref:F-box protein At5g07610-like n=1 Tax=Triticum aestivum TaxID=4565 RepID=UPI0008424756|nr:F-box protein At5g07610-like [Triticum aestivum]
MPQGRRGGGEQGCTEQGHAPATVHPGHGEDVPCHSPPPFPITEMKKEHGHEQQASLPHGCSEQDHSPSTGNPGRDSATPPFPSTDEASDSEQQQQQPGCPTDLPEGAIVEILSRVPYRSLCRFKCVSKPWLALCSDPEVHKRSPQTLSGFFFIERGRFNFRNLSGRGPPLVDPSLHFLRESYDCFSVEQCCSSLLLCKCWESRHDEEDEYDYVVCNPMTGQWTVLPPVVWLDEEDGDIVYFEPIMDIFLGFDTAAPSRFVVFVPLTNCFCEFTEMAIYSSETGRWNKVQSEWGYKTILVGNSECVFLNGTMHLATHYASVVTVDAEGKIWREIEMPEDMPNKNHLASIGQSQGRLYAWQIDNDHDCQLYVWVLEDSGGGNWTLKYTVNVSELFGRQRGEDDMSYKVFAIHPDCDLIFLTDEEEMAVSYDMENQKVNATCTFSQEFQGVLPYIPCFAEWLFSDGH